MRTARMHERQRGLAAAGLSLRLLGLLVVMVGVLALLPATAVAQDYDYQIRALGGRQGTVGGAAAQTKEYAKGKTIDLEVEFPVTVTNDKYYFRGYRRAGDDNADVVLNQQVTVDRDEDYIATYGLKGAMVTLTIRYVDYDTGEELDRRSYTVKQDATGTDRPIIAAEYVEGYRPLYRYITGTVGEDGLVWDLPYARLTDTTTETTTVTTVPGTTTTTTEVTDAGDAGTTETGAADTGADAGADEGAEDEGEQDAGDEGAADEEAAPPTEEILDVDNPLAGPDGTPLAGGEQGAEGQGATGVSSLFASRTTLLSCLAFMVILFLILLFFFLWWRRRQDEGQEGDSTDEESAEQASESAAQDGQDAQE